MEEGEEVIVLSNYVVQDLWVFFPELGVVEATIGYSFSINSVFVSDVSPIKTIRVLDDDIQPNIFLDLTDEMSESTRGNTLNWRLILRERLEKVDYTFTNTNLLPLLMDVCLLRVEV